MKKFLVAAAIAAPLALALGAVPFDGSSGVALAAQCKPNQQKVAGECYPGPFERTHDQGSGKPIAEPKGQANR